MNLETLETLKKEFINVLDWNEEEGVICVDDGFDIRDFLEDFVISSVNKENTLNNKNIKANIIEHETPINFQNNYIDLQVKVELENCNSNNFLNYHNSGIFFTDSELEIRENKFGEFYEVLVFTLYTSINIEEKLEELKNKD